MRFDKTPLISSALSKRCYYDSFSFSKQMHPFTLSYQWKGPLRSARPAFPPEWWSISCPNFALQEPLCTVSNSIQASVCFMCTAGFLHVWMCVHVCFILISPAGLVRLFLGALSSQLEATAITCLANITPLLHSHTSVSLVFPFMS